MLAETVDALAAFGVRLRVSHSRRSRESSRYWLILVGSEPAPCIQVSPISDVITGSELRNGVQFPGEVVECRRYEVGMGNSRFERFVGLGNRRF